MQDTNKKSNDVSLFGNSEYTLAKQFYFWGQEYSEQFKCVARFIPQKQFARADPKRVHYKIFRYTLVHYHPQTLDVF